MKARILSIICILAPLLAFAGQRASGNYAINDVLDGGGQPSSAPSYANAGSSGIIATVAPTAAGGGFVGQLYTVTTVVLSADSTNVLAGSNVQLHAAANLDDGTALALAPTQLAWSVVSGPITTITSNGLATAGAVAQSTHATVRGDAFGKFGTLQLLVLATPASAAPRLGNVSINTAGAVFSGNNGAPGATFYVLTTTDVTLPLGNWTVIETNTFDAGGSFTFTNTVTLADPQRFYALKVP